MARNAAQTAARALLRHHCAEGETRPSLMGAACRSEMSIDSAVFKIKTRAPATVDADRGAPVDNYLRDLPATRVARSTSYWPPALRTGRPAFAE